MNKKLLTLSLIAMICSILVPVTFVSGQPNPNQIYVTTFGMPETVDPHWAYDTASGECIQNILEPLCIFDKDDPNAYLPALADDWPGLGVNPGKAITPSPPAIPGADSTWYFRIRTNAQWHNPAYGNCTPADVEYSMERGMFFDHSAGPMWMLFEPLLGGGSTYDYDLDLNGKLNKTEWEPLSLAVKTAIESNSTHVWFNLGIPYAPFQQILCQTWACVLDREWSIAHGLWNKTIAETYGWTSIEAYNEFIRTWDPPEPGPLMEQSDAPGPVVPGPSLMGTGPYKLKAINPDPRTGWYTFEKFDNYWRGWPAPGYMFKDGNPAGGFVQYVQVKSVEEWSNRKAQFFSTDPNLQSDITVVPRPNLPELHVGELPVPPNPTPYEAANVLPGFRLFKIDSPILGAMYFTFEVNAASEYAPKVGATVDLDMFKDRYLRLAFAHMINFTEYILDVYLGDAKQSPVCMPGGTAFYNASKPMYDIDIAKATWYFEHALGGAIWANGMTVHTTYNIGNVPRQVACEMLEYNIENLIPWPTLVKPKINIIPTGIPWSIYLPGMKAQMYPDFFVGWLADFPDPHNWLVPFMHPVYGTYARRQKVTYGLDPTTLNANWSPTADYGPPPYTNALGEYVNAINNTYVAHLIDTAVGEASAIREKLYNELFDIYYAECTQLPLVYTVTRQYERTWVQGTAKTYNLNPINPGVGTSGYWYVMWKAPSATVYAADVSATATIVNDTKVFSPIQVYLSVANEIDGDMRLMGAPVKVNYSIHLEYLTGPPVIWVLVALKRTNATGDPTSPWSTPIAFAISMTPGSGITYEVTWYEDGVSTEVGGTGTMEPGVWTISLYVSPTGVPGGEVYDPDLTNNEANSAHIVTAIQWVLDLNGDGKVDMKDVRQSAKAFGTYPGHDRWDPDADINDDNKVDMKDIRAIAKKFGATFLTEFG